MKRLGIVLFLICIGGSIKAQNANWARQMDDPTVNFYTTQQNFNNYWSEHTYEKGKGYKQFKRWESFMEPRVFPSGNIPSVDALITAQSQLQLSTPDNVGQWKPIGPFDGNSLPGIGRVNVIEFDLADALSMWIGTPSGGLWRTVDAGQSWQSATAEFTNLGVSDIAIDPNNSNVIYVATGDRDGGDTYSYGVIKSVDGGQTWISTGLTHSVSAQLKVAKVHVNPVQSNIILATSSLGIYRSTDYGVTWNVVQSGSFGSMVQKTANPNILFAASEGNNNIYKSEDAGSSWFPINSSVLPSNGVLRVELATAEADSNYIYAVYAESTNNGFLGVFLSTDGGGTWAQQSSSPNLLGWQSAGNDIGGQAWYDLSIAVDPFDKNEVYVGGVNIWKSVDAGQTWNIFSHWSGGGGAPYLHADIHHINIHPLSGNIYAASDGGVSKYRRSILNWEELNNGLNISQYHSISGSPIDTGLIIAGAQDNGTHFYNGGTWSQILSGDGMKCKVHPKNNSIFYASKHNGSFEKSTDGGQSFNAPFNLPPSGTGNWVTPFVMNSKNPDTLYVGFKEIWRSYNGGLSFSRLMSSSGSGTSNIDVLSISESKREVLAFANDDKLYQTKDGGNSWTHLNSLNNSMSVTDIEYSPLNSNIIAVTFSGYTANEKLMLSNDGGATWVNLSNGLPNVPANCVLIENNAEQSIYVGTDLGVFYRDLILNKWIQYNVGLPNVIVNDLEINYSNRIIRAATYGRGIWKCPVYSDLVVPNASMHVQANSCVNDTLQLFSTSTYHPDSYSWEVSPSNFIYVNGTSHQSKNPEIVFTQSGFYNIGLKVSNVIGRDSVYTVSAVAVGGRPLPYFENVQEHNEEMGWSFDTEKPHGWSVHQTANDFSFKASLFKDTSKSAYELISPTLNLIGHDSLWLTFDHSYSGDASIKTDSLEVWVATGCSENWQRVASFGEDGAGSFQTTAGRAWVFYPQLRDWCNSSGFSNCNKVDLNAFIGSSGVRVKFVALSNGGNNLYLDNIRVSGQPILAPIAEFSSNTQACAGDAIHFFDQTFGSPYSWKWTFSGPQNFVSTQQNPDIVFTQPGTYTVKLLTSNSVNSDSIEKVAYISVTPADSVKINLNYNGSYVCTSDTLFLNPIVSGVGPDADYLWYVNSKLIARSNNPNVAIHPVNQGDKIYLKVQSDMICAYPSLMVSDTIKPKVYPKVAVKLAKLNSFCESDSSYIKLQGYPSGGSYVGLGVFGSEFVPAIAGIGDHKLKYVYQDSNGCVYSSYTSVKVEPTMHISVSNNYSICTGDLPELMNVATPLGGTYRGAGVTNNVLDPQKLGAGLHQFLYTVNTGACGSVSKSFDLLILKTDIPSIKKQGNQLICNVTAKAYQWLDENDNVMFGANGKTFTPPVDGKYKVEIRGLNGCYASSDYVSYYVGLTELPYGVNFNLYPNPAKDYLKLQFKGLVKNSELAISFTNALGATVHKEIKGLSETQELEIRLNELPQGMYTLGIEGENIHISRKVIISD